MAINPNSNLIAVTGGKGGVGKSVFAANLAFSFLELKAPVLLIDMDAESGGDQNLLLGLREVKSLSDLAAFNGTIAPPIFSSIMTPHPKGLSYIAAVKTRDESLNVSTEIAIRQIEALSSHYKYIIVDIGTKLNDLQLALLEKATIALIVTTPEMLALNQTLKLMNELTLATLPSDVMNIVLNKASNAWMPPDAIEKILRKPLMGVIPQDDVTASGSVQRNTPFVLSSPQAPISRSYAELVRKLGGGILQNLKNAAKPQQLRIQRDSQVSGGATKVTPTGGASSSSDPKVSIKLGLHAELRKDQEMQKALENSANFGNDPEKDKALFLKTTAVVSKIIDRDQPQLSRDERKKIIEEVVNEAVALGPLEDLLADPTVTEIMVNGPNKIFVEKKGIVQLSPLTFSSEVALMTVIKRIVDPLGRHINEMNPYVDARLKDGSRVNAVIRPLSIDGPAVTIRKFSKKQIGPEQYYRDWGACTENMMEFLRLCVYHKRNIIISGGTGSGKTTLLNTLSGFIPANERLVTIEDAAELQLKQEHVVRLESRPVNSEGKGGVSIRDLVKNALRMRPERIVVGECRDGAALDMLSAMGTGHDGSMTTLHSNSPRECIGRLETLCLMAGMDLPAKAIREQIAGSVNIIVQISRLSDGSRKIMSIQEVQGMSGDVVTLQPIFDFVETGVNSQRKIEGKFVTQGLIPKFIQKLQQKNEPIPPGLFSNEAPKLASAPPAPGTPGAPGAPKPISGTHTPPPVPPGMQNNIKKPTGTGGH